MNEVAGPVVELSREKNPISKFEIRCRACQSYDITIEIDWAAYPSCSWNKSTIICRSCHQEEMIANH